MSEYQSEIIEQMGKVSNDMAHIIGRYKGSMGVCVDEVRQIMSLPNVSDYAKRRLEALATVMEQSIQRNEELWANRGKREATDIVELERA